MCRRSKTVMGDGRATTVLFNPLRFIAYRHDPAHADILAFLALAPSFEPRAYRRALSDQVPFTFHGRLP